MLKTFLLARKLLFFLIPLLIVVFLANCTTNATNGVSPATKFNVKGCKDVAILLPATDEASRWEQFDRPLLEKEIINNISDVTLRYFNANGNADLQEKQAGIALEKGSCILVVTASDSDKAVNIVEKAKSKGVPVIGYDRWIDDDDLAFYISFDSIKVGELQGEYVVNEFSKKDDGKYRLQSGANLVIINGDLKDRNTKELQQGWENKLKGLIDSKELNLIFPTSFKDDTNYLGWDGDKAKSKIQELLNKSQNNIQIICVANDAMANAIIGVLGELRGKVLVTGQDGHSKSTAKNIVRSYQAMTVYKPIKTIAKQTASLVAALSNGTKTDTLMNTDDRKTQNGKIIPSFLAKSFSVEQRDIKNILVPDGIVNLEELCQDLPKQSGGVCP